MKAQELTAKELRIGNWVNADVGIPINHEHCIQSHDIDDIDKGRASVWGIPLSEEWYKKLGVFESFEFAKVFRVWTGREGEITVEQYAEGEFPLPHIKYVHQLQNLYFALTGNELSITPTK